MVLASSWRSERRLPARVHEALAAHADADVRSGWLQRSDCPARLLNRRAVVERDQHVLQLIAAHPNLDDRGKTLLSAHPIVAVAVAVAFRDDLPDDQALGILRARGRTKVKDALREGGKVGSQYRHAASNGSVNWLGRRRWIRNIAEKPLVATYVAEISDLTVLKEFSDLLRDTPAANAMHASIVTRLLCLWEPEPAQMAMVLAMLASIDVPLDDRIRHRSSTGGLLGWWVGLSDALELGSEIPTVSDPDLLPMCERVMFALDARRANLLCSRLEAPSTAMGLRTDLSDDSYIQLMKLGGSSQVSLLLRGISSPWSEAMVATGTRILAAGKDNSNMDALIRVGVLHLSVIVANSNNNPRLLRAVAQFPGCTLELVRQLPAAQAFSSYHSPDELADWVLRHAGSAIDVVSTLSTHFVGSVDELLEIALSVNKA